MRAARGRQQGRGAICAGRVLVAVLASAACSTQQDADATTPPELPRCDLRPVSEPRLLAEGDDVGILAVLAGGEHVGVLWRAARSADGLATYRIYDRARGFEIASHSLPAPAFLATWSDELLVEHVVPDGRDCDVLVSRIVYAARRAPEIGPVFGGSFDYPHPGSVGTMHATVMDEATFFHINHHYWECGAEHDTVHPWMYVVAESRLFPGASRAPAWGEQWQAMLGYFEMAPLRGNVLLLGSNVSARTVGGDWDGCGASEKCLLEITPGAEILRVDHLGAGGTTGCCNLLAARNGTVLLLRVDPDDETRRFVRAVRLDPGQPLRELAEWEIGGVEYQTDWRSPGGGPRRAAAPAGSGFALLASRPAGGSPGALTRLILIDEDGVEAAAVELPQVPAPDTWNPDPAWIVWHGLAGTERCIDVAWSIVELTGADDDRPSEVWLQSFCCAP